MYIIIACNQTLNDVLFEFEVSCREGGKYRVYVKLYIFHHRMNCRFDRNKPVSRHRDETHHAMTLVPARDHSLT